MQAQQQAQQIQMEQVAADIRSKNAKAARDEAGAELTKAQTVAQNMDAAANAMVAATAVIMQPTIAKVADNLLIQGGWTGGQPVPAGLPMAAQGIPPQAVQQPPAQQAPVAPQPQAGA
jgi:hypothetical protein